MRTVILMMVLMIASMSYGQQVGKCYNISGVITDKLSSSEYVFNAGGAGFGGMKDGVISMQSVSGNIIGNGFHSIVEYRGMKIVSIPELSGHVTQYNLFSYKVNERCQKELGAKNAAQDKKIAEATAQRAKELNDNAAKQAALNKQHKEYVTSRMPYISSLASTMKCPTGTAPYFDEDGGPKAYCVTTPDLRFADGPVIKLNDNITMRISSGSYQTGLYVVDEYYDNNDKPRAKTPEEIQEIKDTKQGAVWRAKAGITGH